MISKIRIPTVFLFIFITIPLIAFSAQGIEDNWGQIKSIRNHLSKQHFFETLNFSDEESFKSASIEKQYETAKAFTEKKLHKMSSQYAWDSVLRHGVYLAPAVFIAAALVRSCPNSTNIIMTTSAALVSVFMPFVFSAGSQVYYTINPPELPEKDLIIEYGSKRHLFDKVTQAYIEESLFYRFWQTENPEQYDKLVKVMDKALRIPIYSKPLSYNPGSITNKLHSFTPSLVDRLERFVFSEIIFQKMDQKLDIHYPVYFQGAPGTGKTYAAKHIAKSMGTNLASVTLDGASIDDIVGTPFDSLDAKPGRILESIIANTESIKNLNHHNQVLLIDEFDRLLINNHKSSQDIIAFFLKILDPNHRYFYSPYLKTNIHLPDTIILAGNSDIQAISSQHHQLQAISSRLDQIIFDGFSPASKFELAINILIPRMEKSYQSIDNSLANFSLNDNNLKEIKNFLELDTDPGLRSLEKFISTLFERKVQGLWPPTF